MLIQRVRASDSERIAHTRNRVVRLVLGHIQPAAGNIVVAHQTEAVSQLEQIEPGLAAEKRLVVDGPAQTDRGEEIETVPLAELLGTVIGAVGFQHIP